MVQLLWTYPNPWSLWHIDTGASSSVSSSLDSPSLTFFVSYSNPSSSSPPRNCEHPFRLCHLLTSCLPLLLFPLKASGIHLAYSTPQTYILQPCPYTQLPFPYSTSTVFGPEDPWLVPSSSFPHRTGSGIRQLSSHLDPTSDFICDLRQEP